MRKLATLVALSTVVVAPTLSHASPAGDPSGSVPVIADVPEEDPADESNEGPGNSSEPIDGDGLSSQDGDGKTIAFPDICMVPGVSGPIPVPYQDMGQGEAEAVKAPVSKGTKNKLTGETDAESEQEQGNDVVTMKTEFAAVPAPIDASTVVPIAHNFDVWVDEVMASPPPPPTECDEDTLARYWAEQELWVSTASEVLTVMSTFDEAVEIKSEQAEDEEAESFEQARASVEYATVDVAELMAFVVLDGLEACAQ